MALKHDPVERTKAYRRIQKELEVKIAAALTGLYDRTGHLKEQKDRAQARPFLEKAARLGHAEAACELADDLLADSLTMTPAEQNAAVYAAIALYAAAAARGSERGRQELAELREWFDHNEESD